MSFVTRPFVNFGESRVESFKVHAFGMQALSSNLEVGNLSQSQVGMSEQTLKIIE